MTLTLGKRPHAWSNADVRAVPGTAMVTGDGVHFTALVTIAMPHGERNVLAIGQAFPDRTLQLCGTRPPAASLTRPMTPDLSRPIQYAATDAQSRTHRSDANR